MTSKLKEYILGLKANEDPDKSFSLEVRNTDAKRFGSLRLIDKGRVATPQLAANLTKWRNASMSFFLSQFEATDERTYQWLTRVVLPSDDRLLFEVLDEEGRPVGNAGVCNLSDKEGELDNFIRGESGGEPLLFVAAEDALLNWLFSDLAVEIVSLHVFSNNWIPISNHLALGFAITGKYALSKIEKDGMVQHLLNSPHGQPCKFSYLKMTLNRGDYLTRQAGIESRKT
jgi:hypothetical protein